jgi:hypothetical protein
VRDLQTFFEASYIPEPNSGCWLWERGGEEAGYGFIHVNGRNKRVHRFAWEAFRGSIPKGLCVLHRCDVRSCVNPDHLFLGTIADNNADMAFKGRAKGGKGGPSGELHRMAKLTAMDVAEIRNRPEEKSAVLTREYGVGSWAIRSIRNGRGWRGSP